MLIIIRFGDLWTVIPVFNIMLILKKYFLWWNFILFFIIIILPLSTPSILNFRFRHISPLNKNNKKELFQNTTKIEISF